MIAATDCSTGTCVSSGGMAALGVLVIVELAIAALGIWLYARIIGKAGYSRWWVLLGLVPIANLVGFVMFAVKEWPIEQELRMMRLAAGQRAVADQRFGAYGSAQAYGQVGAYGAPAAQAYGADPYAAPYGSAAPQGYGPSAPAPDWQTGGQAYGQQPPQAPYDPGTDPTQRPPSWG
jgi:hypothetical protein